jgi:hypothetical protein
MQGKCTKAKYEQDGNAAYSRVQRYSALVGVVRVAPRSEVLWKCILNIQPAEVYVQVSPNIQSHTTTSVL